MNSLRRGFPLLLLRGAECTRQTFDDLGAWAAEIREAQAFGWILA
jgi:hypothetical protein